MCTKKKNKHESAFRINSNSDANTTTENVKTINGK